MVHVGRVRGIEAEAVHVVFSQEELAGVDEHVLHVLLLRGHAVTPGRAAIEVETAFIRAELLVRVLEDQFPERVEVVARVVEHLVENHGQTVLMGGVHQHAEVIRGAEVPLDGAVERWAVAQRPGALRAWELSERHQSEGGDAEIVEVARANPFGDPGESPRPVDAASPSVKP